MRVLILTTIMAPYRVNLFNELGKLCDLTVCFEQKADKSRNDSWYDDKAINFKFVALKHWEKSLKKIKLSISNYVNKNKFDIAIAYEYSTPTAMFFMQLCKLKKIPYLINCDGAFVSSNLIKGLVKSYFIIGASGYLANGSNARKYFINYGANEEKIYNHNFSSLYKSEILEEPITLDEKIKLKNELKLPNKKVVISVGQFIYRKGLDVLLEAWNYIDNDNVHLLIIGEGEKKSEYKKIIQDNNYNNVSIMNFMDKRTLFRYYKACDLFVLPTREDIWGLVINEAMACGLPIITTDKCIAGIELIEDYKNGFIIPTDNSKELSKKLNKLISNKNLCEQMSKNNIKKIKTYNLEDLALSHIKVIKNIN
ncbi:glycosyltransferase family 4 protein [Clostridium perfringens]|uniref:glycosyltransferase family 4 protein n=1 Tax=Clostridium perfringens TaxID=1502 RepID=UPI0024BD32EA|nr:glycosyltransferase family 4 protein [Clostridium perfringens]MDK0765809.1 glycosyltransferase family 4 protein [Clostridium perfringens]MDM0521982.1 glycosyltransferase family 4 protein [Clostridium perfringens]MDU4119213.1 glycosyltransferase family 4 protein [Clostridium perfringens]MDU7237234.1 glycosyltransferase family 4 protein [Clostridium perfringens]MDU8990557.1 glycosyltransferase family 4 protein [Clostridium perfringens]